MVMKEDCLIFTDTQNCVVVVPLDAVKKIKFEPRSSGERTGYRVCIDYDFDVDKDTEHYITEEEFEQLQLHSRY